MKRWIPHHCIDIEHWTIIPNKEDDHLFRWHATMLNLAIGDIDEDRYIVKWQVKKNPINLGEDLA